MEAIFVRTGRILHLHVGGEVIRTTPEHPFYAHTKGWVEAGMLQEGDWLLAMTGTWLRVEEVFDTGSYDRVYNMRVQDWHTYFVGSDDWGFEVWAHNAEYTLEQVLEKAKQSGIDLTEAQAQEILARVNTGQITLDDGVAAAKAGTDVSPTGLEVTYDAAGKPVQWRWTVGGKGQRGPGYREVDVPSGQHRGHVMAVNEGAKVNPIDDGAPNIIPQTPIVNLSNVKRFENWRVANAQGQEVIVTQLPNGYQRWQIPGKNIDVTFNPQSTTRWADNWFLNGGTFD